MAPSFLSKLVKASSPTHSRDRSDRSLESPGASSPHLPRARVASSAGQSQASKPTSASSTPTSSEIKTNHAPTITTTSVNKSTATLNSVGSGSTQPNVTIVPPSPLVKNSSIDSDQDSVYSDQAHSVSKPGTKANNNSSSRSTVIPSPSKTPTNDDDYNLTSTPTTPTIATTVKAPVPRSRPVTPASSKSNLRESGDKQKETPAEMQRTLDPGHEVRRQPSNKSLNQLPPITIAHGRAATMPDSHDKSQSGTIYASMRPIVESPTGIKMPEYSIPIPPIPQEHLNGHARDSDAISLRSTNTMNNKEKKRPWSRSTTSRKPTGLASAIAASGLAMANPTLSAAQQAQMSPPVINAQTSNGTNASRRSSNPGSPPYMTRSPTNSSSHFRHRSAELSPRSSKSKRSGSSGKSARRRGTSISVNSDHASEYHGDDKPEYYSGLEEDSSEDDDDSSSDDDLMDLDLGEEDIPVTGFAVASNKRNADFHELFPTIPEGDYLIEDYGCALQREILIQGRIYVSENHICFHANIFGWITDLSIPIYEIMSLEKKMTAFVIPNAIQITTRQAKYTFASFLSRDTTYDVIYNIWRLARPGDSGSIMSGHNSIEEPSVAPVAEVAVIGANAVMGRKPTQCQCGKEGKHYTETAMEVVIPGTPERIHNLMFASGFIKDFMAGNQKLLDIQISDWAPTAPGSKLLTRNMSYIKPLNGSLGPKQTKCEITDEMVHCDFDEYISTITTTRTPEVPSGGSFSVKTRTCIMWANAISSKIIVTTQVDWTGRSFIKGIIEKSAIDGQKVYHKALENSMRSYIQEHHSEFIPEGMDPAALAVVAEGLPLEAAVAQSREINGAGEVVTEEERKRREHERNRRGLQWAWDTFDGASQVAIRSTKGALELIRDAWDQSSSTTILIFLIVFLVLSNLWTLTRMGSREDAGRRKELKKMEDREKWVQSIVAALWEELSSGKRDVDLNAIPVGGGDQVSVDPKNVRVSEGLPVNWKNEMVELHQTLDAVETRIKAIRESLNSEGLNALD